MVDRDGGVTVLKQGLGSLVYDVSKVSGWLRIKTREWKWRWRVLAQNCQVEQSCAARVFERVLECLKL